MLILLKAFVCLFVCLFVCIVRNIWKLFFWSLYHHHHLTPRHWMNQSGFRFSWLIDFLSLKLCLFLSVFEYFEHLNFTKLKLDDFKVFGSCKWSMSTRKFEGLKEPKKPCYYNPFMRTFTPMSCIFEVIKLVINLDLVVTNVISLRTQSK